MDQFATTIAGPDPQGHLYFERLLTEVSASCVNIPRAGTSILGLRSIGERVRLAQGHCLIERAPGRGTTVSAALPRAAGAGASQGRAAV